MTAFDNSEFEKTEAEAKARWGETDAYKQYEAKAGKCSARELGKAAEGLDQIMEEFAQCRKSGGTAVSAETQALVKRLQGYITEHYYSCTDQILAGLGSMYVSDGRFRHNIDKHGEGTAMFIREAIEVYCRN